MTLDPLLEARNAAKNGVHWKKVLALILKEKNHLHATKNKRVSELTITERKDILYNGFIRIRQLGYKIENPFRVGPQHIVALARSWEEEGLSASTLQKRISTFRTYAGWINKANIVPQNGADLLIDRERFVRVCFTDHDKSWAASGVSPARILAEADALEAASGVWIRLCWAFGLRRQEAMMLDPYQVVDGEIVVSRGTKGGRERYVPIDTGLKVTMLAYARFYADMNGGSLIPRDLTLVKAYKRMSAVLLSLGITKQQSCVVLHGLRAQYACDRLEAQGVIAPVRGGIINDPDKYDAAVIKVMEELGHSRVKIGSFYYGKFAVAK